MSAGRVGSMPLVSLSRLSLSLVSLSLSRLSLSLVSLSLSSLSLSTHTILHWYYEPGHSERPL